MGLEDATCVATGAGSGIGRSVAETLLERGAAVVAHDLAADRLADLAERGAATVAGDLADDADRGRLVDAATAAGATHLVNAAGVIALQPVEDVDAATYDRIFAVNARALFFLTQALCPRLPEGGAVVNLSSTAAKAGTTPETAVYARRRRRCCR